MVSTIIFPNEACSQYIHIRKIGFGGKNWAESKELFSVSRAQKCLFKRYILHTVHELNIENRSSQTSIQTGELVRKTPDKGSALVLRDFKHFEAWFLLLLIWLLTGPLLGSIKVSLKVLLIVSLVRFTRTRLTIDINPLWAWKIDKQTTRGVKVLQRTLNRSHMYWLRRELIGTPSEKSKIMFQRRAVLLLKSR